MIEIPDEAVLARVSNFTDEEIAAGKFLEEQVLADQENNDLIRRALAAALGAMYVDPVTTLLPDGSIHVEWPDGAKYALISRELMYGIVANMNAGEVK